MKMKKLCICVCVLPMLLPCSRLTAQTLSLTPTSVGGITHNNDEFQYEDDQALTFASPSVQLINYNTVQVTVTAPAGEAWNVAYTGQGFSSADIRLSIYYGEGFGGPYDSITSGDWQFDYVNGNSSSLDGNFVNNSAIPDSADQLFFDLYEGVTSDFEFTGVTASITFDNSTLAANALTSFNYAQLSYEYEPSDFEAPDPGQELTLQAVPEPSTVALIGLCGVGLLKAFRRRSTLRLGLRRDAA
jgi:PEP-CTERM motif